MAAAEHREDVERLVAERTRELVAAVEASEARFRALTENSRDVTSILDAEGVVRYISPSVRRILGFDPEGLVGRTSFDFVHPDDVAELSAVFARATRDRGVTETNEFRAR